MTDEPSVKEEPPVLPPPIENLLNGIVQVARLVGETSLNRDVAVAFTAFGNELERVIQGGEPPALRRKYP